MREDQLTGWLRNLARGAGGERIGDDAAFLPAGGPWAVTTDTQIEGVHFHPGLDPRVLARRLLAVNLSDLAAVGARPRFALLALAASQSFEHRAFFRAFVDACRKNDVELVGGDLATSPTWTAALTLAGEPTGRSWLKRSSATPGDALWLGGTVGESAAGLALLSQGAQIEGRRVELPSSWHSASPALQSAAKRAIRRHLAPRPQLELGAWLARRGATTNKKNRQTSAAIDLSDGLSRDLHRLCAASGVGAILDEKLIPTSKHFQALCQKLGLTPDALTFGGGEDYVLLFTLPPRTRPNAGRFPGAVKIGQITSGREVALQRSDRLVPIENKGWDHLAEQ